MRIGWPPGSRTEAEDERASAAGRLAEVARLADPDPWRNDLRAALALDAKNGRKEALQALAGSAKFDELGPVSLDLLGNALSAEDDSVAAERVLRRAQVRHAADVWVNYDLALVLQELNRPADAIRFYTAARALRPETAHLLAHALAKQGESDEAIEVFQDLIRLRPKDGPHLVCLGAKLKELGRSREAAEVLEQAVAACREAIRLKPDFAPAHTCLAAALRVQGKLDEAVAAFREAIRLKPDYAFAHGYLVYTLAIQGRHNEAAAACREAIRLEDYDAKAYYLLAFILKGQGDYTGALELVRKGHELDFQKPNRKYPSASAKRVAQAERDLALANRLSAVLRGEDNPVDNIERLTFAGLASDRKDFAAAARLWAEAFVSDPASANDLQAASRYNAACAAALAGTIQGRDDPAPDEAARTGLRARAHDWPRADLGLRSKQFETGDSEDRADAKQALRHWKFDSDLAAIRAADALARLPEAERKDWQSLWAEVDALLARAAKP